MAARCKTKIDSLMIDWLGYRFAYSHWCEDLKQSFSVLGKQTVWQEMNIILVCGMVAISDHNCPSEDVNEDVLSSTHMQNYLCMRGQVLPSVLYVWMQHYSWYLFLIVHMLCDARNNFLSSQTTNKHWIRGKPYIINALWPLQLYSSLVSYWLASQNCWRAAS